MNIPDKIKIGGKIYKVEITDNLVLGCNYSGECVESDLIIRVRPNLAKGHKESVFIHEMLHAIYDFLGYTDHDEKKIDELANTLHMVIQDNSNIFEKALEAPNAKA